QQLLNRLGQKSGYPRRCFRARLPAATRSAFVRHPPAPEQNRRRERLLQARLESCLIVALPARLRVKIVRMNARLAARTLSFVPILLAASVLSLRCGGGGTVQRPPAARFRLVWSDQVHGPLASCA